MKKSLNLILSFALIALIAVFALTGCDSTGNGAVNDTADTSVTEIGKGETVFRFEATDDKGNVSVWKVSTDEKTVGAALLETGLIVGETSEYGLYVTSVNGVTADYNTNQSYWAFYVDGDYAVSGADTTDIEPDKTYAFVYTKG